MTTTPKALIDAKFSEAAATQQYVSQNCKTAIDKFTATNRSASIATLTLHLVPAGGAVGESNAISKAIPAGGSWTFPEVVGHTMESGDTIHTSASATDAVWIRASGRQFT